MKHFNIQILAIIVAAAVHAINFGANHVKYFDKIDPIITIQSNPEAITSFYNVASHAIKILEIYGDHKYFPYFAEPDVLGFFHMVSLCRVIKYFEEHPNIEVKSKFMKEIDSSEKELKELTTLDYYKKGDPEVMKEAVSEFIAFGRELERIGSSPNLISDLDKKLKLKVLKLKSKLIK